MNIDLELIEQLVIKDFYGIITQEEKAQLEDATDRYPEAWSRQQEVKRKLQSDDFKSYLEEHTDEEQFHRLRQRIRQNQRRRNVWKSSLATVVVLFSFVIWYVVTRDAPRSNTDGIVFKGPLNDTVVFELPDGQNIPLGSGRLQMKAGDINISTNEDVLTYQSNTAGKGGLASVKVPAGKWYKVYLSDSSEVHLNSTSRLTFPLQFSGDSREITIVGEAFLKVKARTEPFIVHLPKGRVQVLGTAFNVNTYDNVQRISLVNGAVKVVSGDNSLTLKPGREALIVDGGIKDQNFDEKKVLSWREGEYSIDNLPIGEISKMLIRIYGVNVVVDNSEVAKQRFTGRIIRSKSIENVLDGISAANSIDYYRDSKGVFHIK